MTIASWPPERLPDLVVHELNQYRFHQHIYRVQRQKDEIDRSSPQGKILKIRGSAHRYSISRLPPLRSLARGQIFPMTLSAGHLHPAVFWCCLLLPIETSFGNIAGSVRQRRTGIEGSPDALGSSLDTTPCLGQARRTTGILPSLPSPSRTRAVTVLYYPIQDIITHILSISAGFWFGLCARWRAKVTSAANERWHPICRAPRRPGLDRFLFKVVNHRHGGEAATIVQAVHIHHRTRS